MEAMSSSSSVSVPHESSNYDEFSMQQSLLFSDSLKGMFLSHGTLNGSAIYPQDLKNLRTQLYSAAEYFEVSYTNDNQKQIVVNTLTDYTIKALVNTVDHLGSVTYRVTGLLDEKADEVSGTELRVSCIEQRLRTCQDCIDRQGLSEQSLVMMTPKYHKRYILPVGDTISGSERIVSKYQGLNFDNEDNSNHVKNAVQATIRNPPTSMVRKGHSPSPSPRPANFSFTDKQKASPKRTASPLRSKFPLLRSGSLSNRQTTPVSSRPTTPNPSRPTTPNTSNMRRRYPSEPRKSASMRLPTERDSQKDIEHQPSKSKRLLKALLSRRKSKKDDTLYTFLDEY